MAFSVTFCVGGFVGIKKPSFLGNEGKITARLPTHRFLFCLDNRFLSVGKTLYFLSVLFILLHQDYIKFTARLPKGYPKVLSESLRQDYGKFLK